MSRTDVESQLVGFATDLIEQSGGMVEWPAGESAGIAIAPTELAASLGQSEDTFSLHTQLSDDGLTLMLGGEFIDLAARTLHQFVPAVGGFAFPDLPVRKSEFEDAVQAAFAWQNARAKVLKGAAMAVAYHTWWFHSSLQSEEAWESLLSVTLNAHSGSPVELGDLLNAARLTPARSVAVAVAADQTLPWATQFIQRQTMRQSAAFLGRVEARLNRDRQRLRDYYNALLREATTTNRRAKHVPTEDETAAKQRAVKLELQRKLAELDERYLFDAVLKPVAMAEFQIPAIAIDVEVQRKAAKRTFRLFWNGLLKRMEPMTCSRCQSSGWNFWFTNDEVAPLCGPCYDQKH